MVQMFVILIVFNFPFLDLKKSIYYLNPKTHLRFYA